jgi:uracil-DNA glycosylase family 4
MVPMKRPTLFLARPGGAPAVAGASDDTPLVSGPGRRPSVDWRHVVSAAHPRALAELQAAHRVCQRCVELGFIRRASPVFSGHQGQRILLVGQAPGPVEVDAERPFAGRAGRTLMRWFARAGFPDEDDVRGRVYMTSMTTCFPGKRAEGSGDRAPTPREVSLCAPWLDGVSSLLEPRLILPVGSLALGRFLPGRSLDAAVGRVFDAGGGEAALSSPAVPALLPLPHPSGQSRWLNDPERVARLERAIALLQTLAVWAEGA